MTTHEFTQFILGVRAKSPTNPIDESAAKEVVQLVSGSMIFRLYESLKVSDYDMDAVTEHFEMLCDSGNHFGFLYFIFILADAANEALPDQFDVLTANRFTVPYLTSALMEDWLDFHGDYGS